MSSATVNLPGTFVRCMSGHYYACTRCDEDCPHCATLKALRAENQRLREALDSGKHIVADIAYDVAYTPDELYRWINEAESILFSSALEQEQPR